jgi:hydrophobic/amphiphilic exporter-1 (mainly G- bacteria), HAE1 family
MWMTRVSVHHPVFAAMVMLALMVVGIFSYRKLGVEQMPDVSLPFVSVGIGYPGASPEGVETDITKPLETALNTLPGVKMIRSNSFEGFSNVFVEFRLEVDPDKAAQSVRDKVAQLRPSLPKEAQEPQLDRASGDNQRSIVYLILTSPNRSLRELSFLADKTVKARLERLNGVGSMRLGGMAQRQVDIRLNTQALQQSGIGIDQITQALRSMNLNAPVGEMRGAYGNAVVRVDGRLKSVEDFQNLIVSSRNTERGPVSVRLGQVAEVVDAERETTEITRFNGKRGIGIDVYKVQDANLVKVGKSVIAEAKEIQKLLPPDVELKVWWASSDWVEASLDNVVRTIFEGAGLTLVIVFMFLASWRSTIITGLTLPIAVVATFIALYAFGFTLNYMTLMALSLCIGLLIDDAIVVRENISRHAAMGKSPMDAALDGTNEIGLAVIATTFSIVAVFVPIAFMEGVIGKFFYAFGVTVTVAVLISLFVSFTLDPMLSAYWPDRSHNSGFETPVIGRVLRGFDSLMTRLELRYQRLISWALRWKKVTVGIALLSLVAALGLSTRLGSEFIPQVDEGFTWVNVQLPPGGTLAYADGKAKRAEAAIQDIPEIEMIKTDVSAGNIGLAVKLKNRKERKRSQKEVEEEIRKRMAPIPGMESQIGGNRPIYIALLGNNDAEMERVMKELSARVSKIKGVTDLETSLKPGTPALSVRLKPEAASMGITNASMSSTLRAMVNGETAGIWSAPDGENYSLIVRLPREQRTSLDDLRQLNVATGRARADGSPMVVSLEQVATIERIASPEVIKRQDLQRRVALYAGLKDRSLGEVSKEVDQVIKEMSATLPLGLRFDVGGQQRELDETFGAFIAALGLAIVMLYFILGSQFGSFLQPIAIMASLPLALVGVVLALLVTGSTLNIFSMIGVIMLMGLVTKNAILLVDFANRAQREDGMNQTDALLAAGKVRLRPILMTTAAMILGMLPLALGLGEGSEQQSPMGRAIIGGVITSTLLTLIVVPVLYTWLDRKGAKALAAGLPPKAPGKWNFLARWRSRKDPKISAGSVAGFTQP